MYTYYTVAMKTLEGKIALVTGASKGIGAGIAKELAAEGANVVINYSRDKEGAETVASMIASHGGRAIAVQADVSKSDDSERLVAETVSAFGPISILVNNAGIFEFGPVESITEDQFQRHFATNVWGSINVIQKSLQNFEPNGGSIINISSGATRMLSPGSALYTSSKSALDALTVILSKELGPRGIRVNSISPGATETEGAHAVGAMTDQAQAHYVRQTPLDRIGTPEDIARVAAFLASEQAQWVTGENIFVTGGLR